MIQNSLSLPKISCGPSFKSTPPSILILWQPLVWSLSLQFCLFQMSSKWNCLSLASFTQHITFQIFFIFLCVSIVHSFLLWTNILFCKVPLCGCNSLFIHLPVGHWGYFQFLWLLSKATINIHLEDFVQTQVFIFFWLST